MPRRQVKQPSFHEHLDLMRTRWGSTIVARSAVPEFTGRAVSSGYVANMDAQKKGPKGRFRVGKQTVYPVENLIAWLKERSSDERLPAVKK